MAKLDIGKIITAAVREGVSQAATAPTNSLEPHDVGQVAAIVEGVAKPAIQEAQARVDYITNQESLPASWSFNAAVVAVVSGALTVYGALSDGYIPASDNLVIIGTAGTLISATMWLIGRLRGKPIGQ